MKKFLITATVLLFFSISVFAECISTYELTADTQILSKRGALCAITIMTDGSNDARVILYDVAAVGDIAITNKLMEITVKGADHYGGRIWDSGNNVRFTEGLYADINGTGASFIVEWK
jgi:hypothetical protein